MKRNDDETLMFQRCRTVDGRSRIIQLGKRNGRVVGLFTPDWASFGMEAEIEIANRRRNELRRELCMNLNPMERRTWLQIIDGNSIQEISRREGVSRAAIYQRIRGNSKWEGGMIARNPYVALWWCLRHKKPQPQ